MGRRGRRRRGIEHITRPLPVLNRVRVPTRGGSLPHMAATVDPTVDLTVDVEALLDVPVAELMAQAAARRDAAHGARITFSPKVFIPLTMLCRDRCGYCTFAKPPAHLDVALPRARRGARHRPRAAPRSAATRRSSPWARRPRTRYPDAAEWLAAHGYASTVDYLVAAAGAVLDRDRPAPPRQRRRAHRGRARCGSGRCRRRRG